MVDLRFLNSGQDQPDVQDEEDWFVGADPDHPVIPSRTSMG
jgi:hypothetical protein